jgi:predicted nicotinamide N-methyase
MVIEGIPGGLRSCAGFEPDNRPIPMPGAVDRRAFIEANTAWIRPPHVPEIELRLASELYPIWRMTEDELAAQSVPPPFWAFAWAGGQAVARYLLDDPLLARGRTVLDVGSGSGLCAIAAALCGAGAVTAADLDPFAADAVALNAKRAGVAVTSSGDDLVGRDGGWDLILIGDLFYEQPLAGRVEDWARSLVRRGAEVIVGDPGRSYLPKSGLNLLAEYEVPTTRELEDREVRRTRVYRVDASP